jgi:hypothetical protein
VRQSATWEASVSHIFRDREEFMRRMKGKRRKSIFTLAFHSLGSTVSSVWLGVIGKGQERGKQEQIAEGRYPLLRKLELVI